MFNSCHHAYAWAFEVLEVWRAGKGFDPDPDKLGGGGTGALGAVIRAIDVEAIADKHDPGIDVKRGKPTDRSKSWFEQYFIAQSEFRGWRLHEKRALETSICSFCKELIDRNLIPDQPCRGCHVLRISEITQENV